MSAFIVSFLVITAAEMADKTQLIALFLAARFRKPVPIILGMFAAVLISHLASAFLGEWIGEVMNYRLLHLLLGVAFLSAAIWAFTPDTVHERDIVKHTHHGVFLSSFIAFSIAEIGDKTQLATMALAARFLTVIPVVIGSTLGIMAVNTPVILLSHAVTDRNVLKWVKVASGVMFVFFGFYELGQLF
jgi:putative Ca2+/H+ antiporter (TMEM165/GDT1 family)